MNGTGPSTSSANASTIWLPTPDLTPSSADLGRQQDAMMTLELDDSPRTARTGTASTARSTALSRRARADTGCRAWASCPTQGRRQGCTTNRNLLPQIVIAALGQTAVQPRIQQQGRERERHVRALHQHQQRQRQHDGRRLDEQQHRTSHARHHDAKRQQARQQMRQRQAFALHHHERVRQQEHHQRYRAERNGRQADEHQPRQLELDGQPVQREQAQQQEVQRVAKLPRLLAVVFDEQKPEHQRGKVYESKLEDHARAFTRADTG